jgi:hypothetical protein
MGCTPMTPAPGEKFVLLRPHPCRHLLRVPLWRDAHVPTLPGSWDALEMLVSNAWVPTSWASLRAAGRGRLTWRVVSE